MPNRKYLCLHRRVPGERQQPSSAQVQEMHAVFNSWKEKFKANIVDMGGGLKPGGRWRAPKRRGQSDGSSLARARSETPGRERFTAGRFQFSGADLYCYRLLLAWRVVTQRSVAPTPPGRSDAKNSVRAS
jgi:hypothetical protein